MGNEQSGHKNGAEKLKKSDKKEKHEDRTSGASDVVDTKAPDVVAEASAGLASVLPVSTGPSSEISPAETVTNNQAQIEIPVEKEIPLDTKTSSHEPQVSEIPVDTKISSHEPQVEQPKPVELTKTETFFYECKADEETADKIDAIPESSLVVEIPVAKPEANIVVEIPVAKAEPNVVVEKPVAKTESVNAEKPVAKTEPSVVAEKPVAKAEPSVVTEKPIAKAEDSSKALDEPVLLQSLLSLEGNTGESSRTIDSTIGESGRTTLINKEALEPQIKSTEKQVTELERVSTDTLNAPLLTVMKDDGPESPRKEIVEKKENLKRNKSFLSSFLCCTAPQ